MSESGLTMKEKVKLVTELTEDISAAVISYHRFGLWKGCRYRVYQNLN